MTPTLTGRWQARAFVLVVFGLPITTLFVLYDKETLYFRVLAYVAVFGVGWDVVYTLVQRLRWERDWPTMFQVASGFCEGAVLYFVADRIGLPGIAAGSVPAGRFAAHFGSVWLAGFLWSQGPVRVFFPYARFHGGRYFPVVTEAERGRAHGAAANPTPAGDTIPA